jgi:hypothetical protein
MRAGHGSETILFLSDVGESKPIFGHITGQTPV